MAKAKIIRNNKKEKTRFVKELVNEVLDKAPLVNKKKEEILKWILLNQLNTNN